MPDPAASIIDDFNRASLGANWSTYAAAGADAQINGSATLASSGGYVGSYYNVATYTRPCEAFITNVTDLSTTTAYWGLKFIDTPGSTAGDDDGYYLGTDTADTPDSMKLYRIDNGTETQIPAGTEHTGDMDANDKYAIQLDATHARMWSDEGAGWVERFSQADTTYALTFSVTIDIFGADTDLDNLAAGAIAAAGGPSQRFLWDPRF